MEREKNKASIRRNKDISIKKAGIHVEIEVKYGKNAQKCIETFLKQ